MKKLKRITFNPSIMGGKPCIKGTRITVGTIIGLFASGHSKEKILELYPDLKANDIQEALSYAAWRSEEIEAHESVKSICISNLNISTII